ncbi:MAG TPA: DUF748 domain-containing protein [Rhodocyclaceae bacterium]|nr:DUF748 domain-containing protein [Rhodocyclaceae bacterium]
MLKTKRLRLILLIGLPSLCILAVVAYYAALQLLKQQLTAALGRTGEVQAVNVGLRRIEIIGLRIRASQPAWPGADELRAARVFVTPDLRSLLGGNIVIARVEIEDAALTVLRNRSGMKIVPALLGTPTESRKAKAQPAPQKEGGGPHIRIGRIELRNSRVDFYDATVAAKPHHIPLDQMQLSLDDLVLPALDARSALDLQARVAGQGKLVLKGWLKVSNLDADLRFGLADTPVKLVEPYLFRKQIGEVKAGRLTLDVYLKVAQRRLVAPGHMSLSGLELGGIVGLTREAAALFARSRGMDADTRRPVDLDFTVQGNLDDARFSLNDAIYAQAGMAAVQLIGLGGRKSPADTGSDSGVGDALKKLFGK